MIRDIVLFVAGLGGVAHEVVTRGSERPTLLILFAAMMGLPAFLRSDVQRREGERDERREVTQGDRDERREDADRDRADDEEREARIRRLVERLREEREEK